MTYYKYYKISVAGSENSFADARQFEAESDTDAEQKADLFYRLADDGSPGFEVWQSTRLVHRYCRKYDEPRNFLSPTLRSQPRTNRSL